MSESGNTSASPCFAVVDIGSNTVKVSVYRCLGPHQPVSLRHDADTVRIGYRVAETGVLAEERADRLLATLARFEANARALGATAFTGVATQAFRIAGNAGEVIERIHRETAWRIRVIDAGEETRLTVAGSRPWLVEREANLVADIGGASTELASFSPDGSAIAAASIPIGSGQLFDKYLGASPPPAGLLERAKQAALHAIDASGVVETGVPNLLLPGGTGQFLKMLLESLAPGEPFDPQALCNLHDWLAHRHAIETMERIPIQLDRAQVLPASLAVVEALVLRSNCQAIVAIPSGIRDGIAIGMCSQE
jgi:exopolyphosphatase/guanosine-5'-triphosphate,3'-diphosphate pyrophosphatase